jgi:hypothetical protein
MKALSGSVYLQAEAAVDDIRVLTGVLLSATALSDAEAVVLRWRCGGGSNGGASLLIDSVTLTDTLSRQTVTKSCCRSSSGSMGSSTSSSSLTSPGSGIIVALHDSSAPLIISDADTPAPYSAPSRPLDEQTELPRPPCKIGRCGTYSRKSLLLAAAVSVTRQQVYSFAPTVGVANNREGRRRGAVCCCWLQVLLAVPSVCWLMRDVSSVTDLFSSFMHAQILCIMLPHILLLLRVGLGLPPHPLPLPVLLDPPIAFHSRRGQEQAAAALQMLHWAECCCGGTGDSDALLFCGSGAHAAGAVARWLPRTFHEEMGGCCAHRCSMACGCSNLQNSQCSCAEC